MPRRTHPKSARRIRKKIIRRKAWKISKPIDKTKLAFREIRKDFKRLKKSKQRMQMLWYRTKKEHVALIKDLDKRIKKLKADLRKKKK
jgi:hypothetical protein